MSCHCWCHNSELGYKEYGCVDCNILCQSNINQLIAKNNRSQKQENVSG